MKILYLLDLLGCVALNAPSGNCEKGSLFHLVYSVDIESLTIYIEKEFKAQIKEAYKTLEKVHLRLKAEFLQSSVLIAEVKALESKAEVFEVKALKDEAEAVNIEVLAAKLKIVKSAVGLFLSIVQKVKVVAETTTAIAQAVEFSAKNSTELTKQLGLLERTKDLLKMVETSVEQGKRFTEMSELLIEEVKMSIGAVEIKAKVSEIIVETVKISAEMTEIKSEACNLLVEEARMLAESAKRFAEAAKVTKAIEGPKVFVEALVEIGKLAAEATKAVAEATKEFKAEVATVFVEAAVEAVGEASQKLAEFPEGGVEGAKVLVEAVKALVAL